MPNYYDKVIIKTNWTEYVAYFKGDHFLTTEGKEISLTVVRKWAELPALHEFKVKVK